MDDLAAGSHTPPSWIEEERSDRAYLMGHGGLWRVVNELQRTPCPHCGEELYGRLTRVLFFSKDNSLLSEELHYSSHRDPATLKRMFVKMLNGDQGVSEQQREDGSWALRVGDHFIGIQVAHRANG